MQSVLQTAAYKTHEPAIRAFARYAAAVAAAYAANKQALQGVDFDDLLIRARDLLGATRRPAPLRLHPARRGPGHLAHPVRNPAPPVEPEGQPPGPLRGHQAVHLRLAQRRSPRHARPGSGAANQPTRFIHRLAHEFPQQGMILDGGESPFRRGLREGYTAEDELLRRRAAARTRRAGGRTLPGTDRARRRATARKLPTVKREPAPR